MTKMLVMIWKVDMDLLAFAICFLSLYVAPYPFTYLHFLLEVNWKPKSCRIRKILTTRIRTPYLKRSRFILDTLILMLAWTKFKYNKYIYTRQQFCHKWPSYDQFEHKNSTLFVILIVLLNTISYCETMVLHFGYVSFHVRDSIVYSTKYFFIQHFTQRKKEAISHHYL